MKYIHIYQQVYYCVQYNKCRFPTTFQKCFDTQPDMVEGTKETQKYSNPKSSQ